MNQKHYEQSRHMAITAYKLLASSPVDHKAASLLLYAARTIDSDAVKDLNKLMWDNWEAGFEYELPRDSSGRSGTFEDTFDYQFPHDPEPARRFLCEQGKK